MGHAFTHRERILVESKISPYLTVVHQTNLWLPTNTQNKRQDGDGEEEEAGYR